MPTTGDPPSRTRVILAFVGAFLAVALVYGCVFVVPPLISTFTDDLGLSHAQAGLLMSAYLAAYALTSFLSGPLADRVGLVRAISGGLVLAGLAGILFASTSSLAVFLVARALLGVSVAIVYAPGITLVSRLVPPQRLNLAVGIFLSGVSAGIAVAFLLTPLLEDALSWRWPFVVFAIATIAGAAAFALLAHGLGGARSAAGAERRGELASLFRNAAFVRVCAGLFTGMFALYGVYTWIAPYLDESAGFSAGRISLALTAGTVVGIPATMAAGWLADRLGRPVAVAGLGLATAIAVLPFAMTDTISYPAALAITLVASAGTTAGMSVLFAVPPRTVAPAQAAGAAGLSVSIAMAGAITSTYVGGALVGWTDGYDVPFVVFSIATLVAVLVVFPIAARGLARARPGSA
ncbi:MAG: MFS transporter [Thermoleophilia bacterium]